MTNIAEKMSQSGQVVEDIAEIQLRQTLLFWSIANNKNTTLGNIYYVTGLLKAVVNW